MKSYFFFLLLNLVFYAKAFSNDTLRYKLSFEKYREQRITVNLELNPPSGAHDLVLQLPVWTPGYYQLMDYPEGVSQFSASDAEGHLLETRGTGKGGWRLQLKTPGPVRISYTVAAEKSFVAENALDEQHAYIVPAATFLSVKDALDRPVLIKIIPLDHWRDVATGLKQVATNTYLAGDADILYDSPILSADLTQVAHFNVRGVPHKFLAYRVPRGDYAKFGKDLQSILNEAAEMMGEVPFSDYTFLGIGKGQGGIEHLNSTAVSLGGIPREPNERLRLLSFLTHEYFHHYNAKRIRPIELGPFDYQQPEKTRQLWVAEGLTVYYEGILMNRAGILDQGGLLKMWEDEINRYESNPGKKLQSLAQASENTFEEGPFGKGVGKGISYYEKGPIVGLILDLKIRHESENKKCLDDVMRALYEHFYQTKSRGFTEEEFWNLCEQIAGSDLKDIRDYVYTTKELDYRPYLTYAGLELKWIDKRYHLQQKKELSETARAIRDELLKEKK